MCVTNTTHRRVQAVTLTPNQMGGLVNSSRGGSCGPSALSQRLLGAFCPQPIASLPTAVASCQTNSTYHPHVLEYPTYPTTGDNHNNPGESKPRPKRRRKPQKPGKTAKLNDRHFVVHNYHDHSLDPVTDCSSSNCSSSHADMDDSSHMMEDESHAGVGGAASSSSRRRGGVAVAFPLKLHAVLEQVERDGYASVISWSPHGRCFVIHKPKQFVEEVMPKYFRQSKLTSFQRQLNLYGFARLTRGPDAGGYYHELFLRHREHLCQKMIRTKVKGTKFKAASSPDSEPDFYVMPPVTALITPHHSDGEEELSYDNGMARNNNSNNTGVVSQSHPVVQQVTYQPTYAATAPVPLYASVPVASLTTPSYTDSFSPSSFSASFGNPTTTAANYKSSSDQILDDAVDELFLNELDEQDNLTDFVSDWMYSGNDSSTLLSAGGAPVISNDYLNDDAQLGFMLEKLLED